MHNVEHYTYDENIHRDYVQRELDHHAAVEGYQEGCKGLGKQIRWLESLDICADYEEAEKVIEKNDNGWYDQLAVRYYEPVRAKPTKAQDELQERVNKAYNRWLKMDQVIYPQVLTSEYIGCKSCGSRLSRKYLYRNYCPVCRADLRTPAKQQAIKLAKEEWRHANLALRGYINTHSEKAVKWLVKIEYHT